jgi:hypothetical protein
MLGLVIVLDRNDDVLPVVENGPAIVEPIDCENC